MEPTLLQERLFDVSEYHLMGEAGILTEDDRVELIEGRIVTMSPIGSRHAYCVNNLNMLLTRSLQDRAIVSVQNPVRLNRRSEPEPDLAVLRPGDVYAKRLPEPGDVLLLIEVADTSVEMDRRVKVPLYARHGIPEVWLVLIQEQVVEVYRQPKGDAYETVQRFERGQTFVLQAFADVPLGVDAILG